MTVNLAKRSLQIALTISATFFSTAVNAAGQEFVQAQLQRTGSIEGRRMREASGVAVSRTYPGVLWTHNDSGDGPFIFAMNLEGRLLATFDVRGARARDWEDIALGPCPDMPGSCLYIADTGDNGRSRDHASIYIVPEPDPATGTPDSIVKTERSQRVNFRYQDGRSYDVEAIAVAPDGEITLISKGRRSGSGIVEFRIRTEALLEDEPRAEIVSRLPIVPVRHLGRWVTGAAISPSGERLVVRTYTELYFFSRNAEGELSHTPPICWIGASEPQGEAVDFLDGNTVVLVSEALLGRPGTVFTATCTEE